MAQLWAKNEKYTHLATLNSFHPSSITTSHKTNNVLASLHYFVMRAGMRLDIYLATETYYIKVQTCLPYSPACVLLWQISFLISQATPFWERKGLVTVHGGPSWCDGIQFGLTANFKLLEPFDWITGCQLLRDTDMSLSHTYTSSFL